MIQIENVSKTFTGKFGKAEALRIPEHSFANSENGAAHCCGHHAQMGY